VSESRTRETAPMAGFSASHCDRMIVTAAAPGNELAERLVRSNADECSLRVVHGRRSRV